MRIKANEAMNKVRVHVPPTVRCESAEPAAQTYRSDGDFYAQAGQRQGRMLLAGTRTRQAEVAVPV